MYYSTNSEQLMIEDFAMPFGGGTLDPQNRWVRLAGIMPWDHIEQIYLESMSVETGRRAISSRISEYICTGKWPEKDSKDAAQPEQES